jgi:hypothetical protein
MGMSDIKQRLAAIRETDEYKAAYFEATIERLEAEVERLRVALAPFARAGTWDFSTTVYRKPSDEILHNHVGEAVTLGDFFRASEALQEPSDA